MTPRVTVSLCLHLPAGKSCRQTGWWLQRRLSPSSQRTLPFPCSARGRRPSPHLCLEYQCPAVDRHLPEMSSAASQLMCPLLLSGREGAKQAEAPQFGPLRQWLWQRCVPSPSPLSVFHSSTSSQPQILQVACFPQGCLSMIFKIQVPTALSLPPMGESAPTRRSALTSFPNRKQPTLFSHMLLPASQPLPASSPLPRFPALASPLLSSQ